jgi:ABC-2 type transport system ATP-binding protein
VVAALSSHAAIVRVETLSKANGQVDLRAVPSNGAAIATDVASLLHEKGIAVNELFIERGKLDDVFREITTSEEGARHG